MLMSTEGQVKNNAQARRKVHSNCFLSCISLDILKTDDEGRNKGATMRISLTYIKDGTDGERMLHQNAIANSTSRIRLLPAISHL